MTRAKKLGTSSTMDGTVDSPAPAQRLVRGGHDCVDILLRDVPTDDLDLHYSRS